MANYSEAHRNVALKILTAQRAKLKNVSEEAQVVYAVSLLIADDAGTVDNDELERALEDMSVVNAAKVLLWKAQV
jgi:tellurite resistance protein